MAMRDHRPRKASRPVCEALETRELLNAAIMPQLFPAAEVDDGSPHAFQSFSILQHLPSQPQLTASTTPANGDGNPYGVAFVPPGFPTGGKLHPGDILVSNFNSSSGLQATGTTIVQINSTSSANPPANVFFQGQAPLGLTTALGVLKGGFVLVGNTPLNTTATPPTVQQGSLLILDRNGKLVETLTDSKLLDGPWDLTIANDFGPFAQVFVSNVLSGTVTRINLFVPFNGSPPVVLGMTQIASGYKHEPKTAALVVGPTGLAFDAKSDTLYVASTDDNAIYAIPQAALRQSDAGTGNIIYQDNTHLHGPLALALAPNGNLLTTNGDAVNSGGTPNEIVEFTPKGQFIAQAQVDTGVSGAAFGLALTRSDGSLLLAAVDDNTNQVKVWKITSPN